MGSKNIPDIRVVSAGYFYSFTATAILESAVP